MDTNIHYFKIEMERLAEKVIEKFPTMITSSAIETIDTMDGKVTDVIEDFIYNDDNFPDNHIFPDDLWAQLFEDLEYFIFLVIQKRLNQIKIRRFLNNKPHNKVFAYRLRREEE